MLRLAVGVILNLTISTYPFLSFILVRVTPTANRNSYRVAIIVVPATQGSVLRPQPWAGKSQLLQSCRWVRTIPPLGHMYPLKPLQHTPRSAPSSPRLRQPTPRSALSSPHLLQPTPTPAPSTPRLHLPTIPPAPSYPHLRQHTPTPAPSTPCLLQPTPPPTPSSPRLHLPTTPPAPSSPHHHHTAWGNWTALFLQKWG